MNSPPVITIDSAEVLITNVVEMHIQSDLTSLFTTGSLLLKDNSNLYESILKLGSEVIIRFLDNAGRAVLQNTMRVLSFKKLATSAPAIFNEITVALISDWYYKQRPATKGYFGTVSQIITDTLIRDNFFKTKLIETSTDTPRVRYQIAESDAEFLVKLKKLAVNQASSMLLYSTFNNELILRAKSTILGSAIKYTIIPYMDSREDGNTRTLPPIPAYSLALYGDVSESAGTRQTVMTTAHMQLRDKANAKASVMFNSIEIEETKLVAAVTGADISFSGWETSQGDAIASAIYAVDSLSDKVFSLIAITSCLAEEAVNLGDRVELELYNKESPNTAGTYFIKHLDHFYTEGNSFTKLQLVRIPA